MRLIIRLQLIRNNAIQPVGSQWIAKLPLPRGRAAPADRLSLSLSLIPPSPPRKKEVASTLTISLAGRWQGGKAAARRGGGLPTSLRVLSAGKMRFSTFWPAASEHAHVWFPPWRDDTWPTESAGGGVLSDGVSPPSPPPPLDWFSSHGLPLVSPESVVFVLHNRQLTFS